jgi:PAS domain S-box-containing protein
MEAEHAIPGPREVLDCALAFCAVLDASGQVLDASGRGLNGHAFTHDAVRGRPLWDCAWWAHDAAAQGQVRAACVEAAAGRASRLDIEARAIHGRLFMLDLTVRPYERGAGAVSHLVASAIDVTHRVRSEDELRLSSAALKAAVDGADALVWTTDVHGRLTFANAALLEVLGRRAPDAIGRPFARLIEDGAAARRIAEHDRAVLESGEPATIEEEIGLRGGTTSWLTSRSPQRDAAGNLLGVIAVAVNVAERDRTIEALRHADQQKDAFLAMLSHELRNPLSPIVVATHILQSRAPEDAATRGALDILLRQTRQMGRLLDDLLDVARITRNRLDLQIEFVDLVQCVQDAFHSSQALIGAKLHELALHVPRDAVLLRGDPVRLTQVITNLVNNAAKYSPEQSRIDVTVEGYAAEVMLRVQDNGPGIPADVLPELFSGSYHAAAQKRGRQGLGIGLWLTHRLVSLHGGSIAAEIARECGACFNVRLPRS